MSPQSALNATRASFVATRKKNERRVSMSNSELTQAANTAFSLHQRLDSDFEHSSTAKNPLSEASPTKCRIQYRKRKVSLESVPAEDRFSADFLSGIFDDLAKAETVQGIDSDTLHMDSSEISRKKQKRTLSRSVSYFSVHNAQGNKEDDKSKSISTIRDEQKQLSNNDLVPSFIKSTSNEEQIFETTYDGASMRHETAPSCNDAAAIVDHVFSSGLIFPNLPVSISNSSCSSTNLTRTSVESIKVNKNHQSIEGDQDKKEVYGWFVEMDDEISTSLPDTTTVPSSSSQKDLAFVAATAPKQDINNDDEVQWAKAADTVDEVLGDFF